LNTSYDSIQKTYRSHVRHKALWIGVLLIGLVLLSAYAMTMGAYALSARELLAAVIGQADEASKVVLVNIRLPRIVAALICGWGLSLAGLVIQSLLKNPLGSPSTLGISQGAAFGASLSIVVFGSRVFSVTAFAFGGAIGATVIILVLARLKRLSPEAIILAGVALASLFASATILLQYLATETELAMVVFWTFGDVARSNWREIFLLTTVVILATGVLYLLRWDLNVMATGESTAQGLGVDVQKIRILGMVLASTVAALATAFHGVIAFVGLIAPHIARRTVGDNHGLLLPFSAVVGAALLLAADTIGRVLIGSGALPVGVITSFLGAPMFLYLLMRGYK